MRLAPKGPEQTSPGQRLGRGIRAAQSPETVVPKRDMSTDVAGWEALPRRLA
jgi:hypothetical protein